ncbi:glycosyltransferase [Thermodesulfovibrio sp. TK110]
MPKKVLMFAGPVHPIPPIKGAAVESWIYEVSKRVISFEPHIVSIGDIYYPESEYKNGIYFHRINFSPLYRRIFQKMTKLDPLSYPKRVLKIINKIKPDIVHIHNTYKWALPVIEKLDKNIKIVLHFHNEINIDKENQVDAFIGCSQFIVEIYKKNNKLKAKHYKCIYNGVDLSKYRPYWEIPELRRSIRERFKIKENEFIVLFIGRVSPEKGVEHFVNTAIRLKNVKNIRFFIVGEISKKGERANYAKEILKKITSYKDKIIFTDVFPPFKMPLIYLIGDIVFSPSNFEEPFSMVNIEAMATGLPVITRAKGGVKEYIKNGINGFFVREEKIDEDASELIVNLYQNERLRKTIGENARDTVKKFDWFYIVEELEKFYMELLTK